MLNFEFQSFENLKNGVHLEIRQLPPGHTLMEPLTSEVCRFLHSYFVYTNDYCADILEEGEIYEGSNQTEACLDDQPTCTANDDMERTFIKESRRGEQRSNHTWTSTAAINPKSKFLVTISLLLFVFLLITTTDSSLGGVRLVTESERMRVKWIRLFQEGRWFQKERREGEGQRG